MQNVGDVRPIIKDTIAPSDKSKLWLKQTDMPNNPNIGEFRVWNESLNEWVLLQYGEYTFVRESLDILSDGQTIFTLSANCVNPNNALVWAMGCKAEIDTHYTIVGNELIWLNADFTLEEGYKIEIFYNI